MITIDHPHDELPNEQGDAVVSEHGEPARTAAPAPEAPPGVPRRRVLWKVLAGVGAFVALGAGAIAADYATNGSHHTTRRFTEPVTTLSVAIDSGSLRVVGGTAGTVTVDVTTHGGLTRPEHFEGVVRGHLMLRSYCDFDLVTPTCETDYVVHVPANTAIVVDSDGADIDLVDVSGDVDMDLNGGDVDMRFSSAPHSVDIDANGGDIDIVVPDDAATYNVDSETNGGSTDVDVRTDRQSANHIDISANGGDINVRYAEAQRVTG